MVVHHRYRPRQFPSSSPTPGQSGKITWRQPASERRHIQASCSRCGRRQHAHVPYRGGAALTDLLGGQVQVMFPACRYVNEYDAI